MNLPWQSYDSVLLNPTATSAPELAKELYQATAKKTTKSEKKQRDRRMFLPKPTVPAQNAPRSLLMPSKDWQSGRSPEGFSPADSSRLTKVPGMISRASKNKDAHSGNLDRAGRAKKPRILAISSLPARSRLPFLRLLAQKDSKKSILRNSGRNDGDFRFGVD